MCVLCVCLCMYVCVHMYVCMYYVYVCVVCVYVCMYVCACVCVHVLCVTVWFVITSNSDLYQNAGLSDPVIPFTIM